MAASDRNDSKLVTVLLASTMFLLGIVVSGVAGVARGDYLGKQAAIEVEVRSKEEREELKRRLTKIEDSIPRIAQDIAEIKVEIKRRRD